MKKITKNRLKHPTNKTSPYPPPNKKKKENKNNKQTKLKKKKKRKKEGKNPKYLNSQYGHITVTM